MNGIENITGPSLQHIAGEHHELVKRVRSVQQLLAGPIPAPSLAEAFAQIRVKLGELLQQMDDHFRQEAAGGYLEDAAARTPRLAALAAVLEQEHPQLYSAVVRLLKTATDSAPAKAAWRRIAAGFNQFAEQMLLHEAKENRLLQQGFNADPALFD